MPDAMNGPREINWEFVVGFGLIGLMIAAHLVLSLVLKRAGGRFGRVAPRASHPVSYWLLIIAESLLLLIVWGGVGYHLWVGGMPSPVGNGVPGNWTG